jgi:hypothetical protein
MSNVVTQKCGDAGLEFSRVRAHRPRHPAIAFSAVTTQLDRKRLADDFHFDEVAEAEAQGLPYVLVPWTLSREEWEKKYCHAPAAEEKKD